MKLNHSQNVNKSGFPFKALMKHWESSSFRSSLWILAVQYKYTELDLQPTFNAVWHKQLSQRACLTVLLSLKICCRKSRFDQTFSAARFQQHIPEELLEEKTQSCSILSKMSLWSFRSSIFLLLVYQHELCLVPCQQFVNKVSASSRLFGFQLFIFNFPASFVLIFNENKHLFK